MVGYEELEKQTFVLDTLNRDIKFRRQDLIRNMKRLAERLQEEALRLDSDPTQVPSSNGYIHCTSLSEDIDNDAARLVILWSTRNTIKSIFEFEGTAFGK